MTHPARARQIGALASALLLVAFVWSGCASDDAPRPSDRKGAARPVPLPNLAGQETFFGGQIMAEMKVGAMTGFTPRGESGAGRPEGRRGGHGGFNVGGVSMGGAGAGGGRHRPGGEEAGPAADPEDSDRPRQLATRRADQMGSPPVMIHLRFTNTGAERAELEIMDFLSPLGNFVVTPSKLGLDPGQTVEVEPMTSRLAGETTEGEISLNLRSGTRRETKTITLKPESVPAQPPPPAAP